MIILWLKFKMMIFTYLEDLYQIQDRVLDAINYGNLVYNFLNGKLLMSKTYKKKEFILINNYNVIILLEMFQFLEVLIQWFMIILIIA